MDKDLRERHIRAFDAMSPEQRRAAYVHQAIKMQLKRIGIISHSFLRKRSKIGPTATGADYGKTAPIFMSASLPAN